MMNSTPHSQHSPAKFSVRPTVGLARALGLALLAAGSLALVGCIGYEKKWERSVAAYEAGRTEGPEGPWVGSWTTTTNGHTGDLRAIVSRSQEHPGEYDFHYHATWAKILAGTYQTRFPARKSGGVYRFDGEEKLGFSGVFRHRAKVTDDRFEATYSNENGDVGSFEMERPGS